MGWKEDTCYIGVYSSSWQKPNFNSDLYWLRWFIDSSWSSNARQDNKKIATASKKYLRLVYKRSNLSRRNRRPAGSGGDLGELLTRITKKISIRNQEEDERLKGFLTQRELSLDIFVAFMLTSRKRYVDGVTRDGGTEGQFSSQLRTRSRRPST